jgi:heme oxygenase
MSLKDLIKDNHDKAENHPFVKLLLSGEIPVPVYADLVYNQMFCYTKLEERAYNEGLLEGIEDICRGPKIEMDYLEMFTPATVYQSTADYAKYVEEMPTDKIMGHIYARHFGDLYGGQMIKKVIPGSGLMYEFDDRKGLIEKVRERLSDDLGDEANVAIEFNIRLFDEIASAHNIMDTNEKESV